jgi:hypothetical protein
VFARLTRLFIIAMCSVPFITALLETPDDKSVIQQLLLFVAGLLVDEEKIAQKAVFKKVCSFIVVEFPLEHSTLWGVCLRSN